MTAPHGVPTSAALRSGTPADAREGGLPERTAATADPPASRRSNDEWLAALHGAGASQDVALHDLHQLLVRAARHQVLRMRGLLPSWGPQRLDDLVQSAADDALTALLDKLDTFQGRSRFTTWAYKFAILEGATQVRRQAWAGREVAFAEVSLAGATREPGPVEEAEARDLASAVAVAMDTVLTSYQRRIAVALLVDEVPIDVLAERLGTTRGALYKTLHVARSRLRATLVAAGYLPAPPSSTPRAADRTAPETKPDPTGAPS